MSLNYLINRNGKPVVLFLPAKSFRIIISCEFPTEKNNVRDLFRERLHKTNKKLIYESINNIDNNNSEIKMIFLNNPKIIKICKNNLEINFPDLKLSKIIFTNDLEENEVYCTDEVNHYRPTNNCEVNSINLE